jgi:hypothetical protein
MANVDFEEGDDILDFWNNYDFSWKSCSDIQHFVDAAVACGAYENSLDAFGGLDENWYTNWFTPVQQAIQEMSDKFSPKELHKAVDVFMEPFMAIDFGNEFAVYDALLKYVPSFPFAWKQHETSLLKYYGSCCDEFSYQTNIGRYFNWTFSPCDTIALMKNIDSKFLERIFVDSFSLDRHQSFRVRLCLARNPKTPKAVLDFLIKYQDGPEWLIMDFEEIKKIKGSYSYIPSEFVGELQDAADYLESLGPYCDFNPMFLEEIFGIPWEVGSGVEALKTALALNPGLSAIELETLYQSEYESVKYFIRKNPSCPDFLGAQSAIEQPTFTFTPYSGDPSDVEDIVLD